MARTALRIALLVVLATGLSVGTTGFTAVEADRTVSVNVVENDEAYVGVVACERSQGGGTGGEPVRVWVENRYTDPLTVESVTSDDAARTDGDGDGVTVGVGDSERLEVVFDDEAPTVSVAVSADGFEATVTRPVTPKSECPYATGSGTSAGSGGNSSTGN